MSDDFKTDLKLSKSLKHAFQQYDWSIEQTAWLIIGFSTVIDPMILRSVVDDQEVKYGTTEYRDAQSAQKKIEDILVENIPRGLGVSSRQATHLDDDAPWRNRYTPKVILDIVTRGFFSGRHIAERISIPWLKVAFDYGLIPGDFIGRPGVQNVLGEASVRETLSRVEAKAEVVKPEKLFKVKPRSESKDTFHKWIHNQLSEYSNAGKKRPSLSEMKQIIKEKKPTMFIKFGRSPKEDKHGKVIKAALSVYYWGDDRTTEVSMTENALKQFIHDVTY